MGSDSFPSDLWTRDNHKEILSIICGTRRQGARSFLNVLNGMKHYECTDVGVYAPLITKLLGMTGAMGGKRVNELVHSFIADALDQFAPSIEVGSGFKTSCDERPNIFRPIFNTEEVRLS